MVGGGLHSALRVRAVALNVVRLLRLPYPAVLRDLLLAADGDGDAMYNRSESMTFVRAVCPSVDDGALALLVHGCL